MAASQSACRKGRPTGKAQAAFPRIREINRTWQDAITRGMSVADKETLQKLLDMMQAEARRLLEGEGA